MPAPCAYAAVGLVRLAKYYSWLHQAPSRFPFSLGRLGWVGPRGATSRVTSPSPLPRQRLRRACAFSPVGPWREVRRTGSGELPWIYGRTRVPPLINPTPPHFRKALARYGTRLAWSPLACLAPSLGLSALLWKFLVNVFFVVSGPTRALRPLSGAFFSGSHLALFARARIVGPVAVPRATVHFWRPFLPRFLRDTVEVQVKSSSCTTSRGVVQVKSGSRSTSRGPSPVKFMYREVLYPSQVKFVYYIAWSRPSRVKFA
jgi:hypothetical protein